MKLPLVVTHANSGRVALSVFLCMRCGNVETRERTIPTKRMRCAAASMGCYPAENELAAPVPAARVSSDNIRVARRYSWAI